VVCEEKKKKNLQRYRTTRALREYDEAYSQKKKPLRVQGIIRCWFMRISPRSELATILRQTKKIGRRGISPDGTKSETARDKVEKRRSRSQ